MAEHSFSAHFCWRNLARAQGLQKTNMPSTERSFYLLNTRTICVIFLYNWTQCVDGFSILLQRYVTIGNDAKKPSNFQLLFVTERTQLNATHAQLLEKLRPIALAETCRFLAIQSLEFQEIWQKNRSEPTWMIYHEKSEFWQGEFLIIEETIDGELRKSPMSKFY